MGTTTTKSTAAVKTAKKITANEQKKLNKISTLYKSYLAVFASEETAVKATTKQITAILKTGLTIPEFYTSLWANGETVPKKWPLSKDGKPLSPNSKKVRNALAYVNRLVSASDMRKKRANDAKKASETPPPVIETKGDTSGTTGVDSAPRVESSDEDITPVKLDGLVRILQATCITIQGDIDGAKTATAKSDAATAYKAAKTLILYFTE